MSKTSPLHISTVIPSRPEALIKVAEEIRKDDPNLQLICNAIKEDVALFSSVIATVNSAFFAISENITSIERAVSLLGMKRTFNIVQVAAVKNSLSSLGPMERYWDTATEVARISAALAKQFTDLDTDQAYLLGMLHDCGIPLMMLGHDDYKEFLITLNGSSLKKISEAETERYGYNHYHIGAELARKWSLGGDVIEAISRQPIYLETFQEPADCKEAMRINLCLLLLAKDVSEAYRHYWRLPNQQEPLIDLKPVLEFLGISDFEYMDLKEDLVATLTGE